MKTFRRLSFVLVLTAAFVAPALADGGIAQTPGWASPGEMQGPGYTQSSTCTDPGQTETPLRCRPGRNPGPRDRYNPINYSEYDLIPPAFRSSIGVTVPR
jgi:hypothetical protein